MKPSYLFAWALILVLIMALEIASPLTYVSPLAWVFVFGLFMALEVAGAMQADKGDTFSELTWTFLYGGKARAGLVVSIAIYLGLRFTLIGGLDVPIPEWAPRAALGAGLIAWLIPHFTRFGNDG
jgi:hypothetical protein